MRRLKSSASTSCARRLDPGERLDGDVVGRRLWRVDVGRLVRVHVPDVEHENLGALGE